MAELISSQAQLADQPRIVQRPLSFAQERLWFLQQFLPPSAASIYHVTLAFRLHGELRLELLEQSLLRMTERHEILRTCFPSSKGIPYQKTLPLPDRFVQPTIDMRDLDTRQLSSAIQAEMDLFQLERFDLEHGPLWRCQVLLLREQEYLLLFNLHHIITDDWSINLFLNELALHYNALLAQQQIQLPAPSLQYADYIQQLRQRQQEGKLAEHEAYWKQKLADAPTTLLLPLDHPRPAVQRFRGEQVPLRLAPELTHQLEQLCRGEQSTLFMGLLAAFQLVLSRLSGQSDLVVGIPIAERGSPELEQMMGFFVHTLPIRVRIPEGLSYREILRQVREATLGAYDHQDMPFEQMVNILHPARDLSIQPFIQTFFAYQNIIISELQLQNIVAEHYPLRQQTARYELLLELFPSPQGIYGHIEYDRDLFDYETIKRWTEHFKTLLQAIVSEPDCALDTLSLLTSAQYLQIVEIWNRTTQPLHEQMIHQLFETYAASTPENLALVFQDQRLTYRQLEERANQLAHYLHQQGVGPEIRVGICLERSIELIVSVLAILKAGGAFVPLDPSYPRARLIHMQKDAQVKIILTQEPFLTRIAQDGIQIVCLEQMHAIIAQQPSTALAASASLDTLCYIIYTSGSTGLPKGVMVPHRGVYNLVMAEKEILQLPPASRVLQFFSYSFDAFLLDLGLSLLAGSTLYIGTSDEIFPGPPLHAFLQKHAIQCMLCSPSALALLPEAHLPDLHTVITGGEVCPADLVARWSPARRFLNLYGPTEITVCATFAECKATTARPPIGKPLANTRVYVLDARLQPVPVGVAGELYIGGIGITRGYCNQPDLTAERFLPDPFSQEPGARLYRSGDLVRWLLDGSLDYLGRSDQQVKIRGFRIESGEIESALRSHPLVYDAVVAVRGDGSSLTAYIVTDGVDLPGTALREFLLRSLPEYMVPSHYVFLSAFPTMPGGKVDRKALAALEQAGIPSAREYIPPQSREEEQLALIWQELLHLPQIGRSDDFFASGGHSLLAAQMLDRLRTTFHVDISVRQIFQNPTLSSLAQLVSRPPDSYVEEPEILPARNRRPAHIPLSFAQEQLWFLDQLFPESANYTTPFALEIQGDLNIEALEQSLMQLIQRHEILRTCFPASQGKPYQHILPSLSHIFTVEDLQHLELELQQQRIHQALQAANLHIFQLATGPLLFVSLLQCAPRRSLFILTMHHIIVDGWSFGILLQELTSLYQAACANEKADLLPLEIQYADYAIWQRQWLQGAEIARQEAYWMQQLAQAQDYLPLPTSFPRPEEQQHQGQTFRFMIPSSFLHEALERYQEEQVTPATLLLAVFALLLHRLSDQEDLVIGMPTTGRTRKQTEPLIGFFITTLAIRTKIAPDQTFRALLQQVRSTLLDAYEHQDLPFERIVDLVRPQRSTAYNPIFQVLFNYLPDVPQKVPLPGLTLERLKIEQPISRFDLSLGVHETEEGLACTLEYRSDLFKAEVIERWSRYYQFLLTQISETTEQPLSAFPVFKLLELSRGVRRFEEASQPVTAYGKVQQFPQQEIDSMKQRRADLDKRRAALPQSKRTLLEKRLRVKREASLQTIQPQPRDGLPPLSFAQERLWFIDQFLKGGTVYTLPFALRMIGSVERETLRASFDYVVARHENLRTSFKHILGIPYQDILPPQPLQMPIHDLRPLSETVRLAALHEQIQQFAQRDFSLDRGPLLRVELIQYEEQAYILLCCLHHIISDGWSMDILWSEVMAHYNASVTRHPLELPPLPVQYADYAIWQRKQFTEQVLEQHMAYWQKQLSGTATFLKLPTDFPRPPVQRFHGKSCPISLSEKQTQALEQLAQRENVTPYMVLTASFMLLLGLLSGQRDFLIGTPVAGRKHREIESLIGLFVNTLLLRTRLDEHISFSAFLQQIRETSLGAYDHQDMPFERLVEMMQPERKLSYNSLAQVLFAFQTTPRSALHMEGVQIELQEIEISTTHCDLSLELVRTEQGLQGSFVYDSDLFLPETVARWARYLVQITASAVTHPGANLAEFMTIPASEYQRVVVEWNSKQREDFPKTSFQRLFEQQVKHTPEAIVLKHGNRQLTYHELDSKANQLAHYLQELGVGPDVPVGVYMERSLELVIVLLAILKAGGAYLPLDPNYPQERLAFMLHDSQAPLLITQSHLQQHLPTYDGKIVDLSVNWLMQLNLTDTTPLQCEVDPDNLAYLIYTSGSTGVPKGVAVPQRNLTNYLLWALERYSPQEMRRVPAYTSLCFDASILELFVPLSCGGTVIMVDDLLKLPEALTEGITLMFAVPSVLNELLKQHTLPATLQTLCLGGEALSLSLLERLTQQSVAGAIDNLYGPTETTINITASRVSHEEGRPTIGRPITNNEAYILDASFQPVPIGVIGELYLGGAGVARGYQGQPALTAERFIPHPFSNRPGQRLYRTGDLVRFLPDGRIDFQGRRDQQVKVRGFRIELREIELRLLQCRGVQASAVGVWGTEEEARLIGYVVLAAGHQRTSDDLREELRQDLPPSMVPGRVMVLEALPLAPSGKVDRKALPEPDFTEIQAAYEPPQDALEECIATIWKEVLHLPNVGRTDNFFHLGGHSLLAMQIIARLRTEISVELPVRMIFDAPTIAAMAIFIRQFREDQPEQSKRLHLAIPIQILPTSQPLAGQQPFFCMHPVGGTVFSYTHLAEALQDTHPLYVFQAQGIEDGLPPLESIEEMAARYMQELRQIQPEGPYALGGWSMGGMIAFEMARQLRAQQQEIRLLALFDTYTTYPLKSEGEDPALYAAFAQDLGLSVRSEHWEVFQMYTASHDIHLLTALLQDEGVVPLDFEAARLAHLLDIFRVHTHALATYVPRTYAGSLLLFRAQETEEPQDNDLGWSRFITGHVEVQVLPGDHYQIIKRQNAHTIAQIIKKSNGTF